MIEIRPIREKNEWNSLLAKEFPSQDDVYFSFEYCELYTRHFPMVPEAIYSCSPSLTVFWPYLVRQIPGSAGKDCIRDITTPYGYGGPILCARTEDKEELARSIREFLDRFRAYMQSCRSVSGFIRFHPLLRSWELLKEEIPCEYLNDVVVMDLTPDPDSLWDHMRKGHRYNIKKTLQEGATVSVTEHPTDEDIDTFLGLYYERMNRNKAQPKYYFTREFIRDHFSLLHAALVQVARDGRVIGSSIFLIGSSVAHYHLSGSAGDIRGLYPSEAALWGFIGWARERGVTCLNLGGGRGANDTLFQFKLGFSRMTAPFYVGKLVFDRPAYERLTAELAPGLASGFFPSYRGHETGNIV